MNHFLHLIESFPDFQMGQSELDSECGPEIVSFLRQSGILVYRGQHVQQISCGLYKSSTVCFRWIKRFRGETFAVCQSRSRACSQQIEPEYKDLRAWELNQEVFAAHIKYLLDLSGTLECKDWLQQPLWYLGHRRQAERYEEFYLLLQPQNVGFAMLLAQLSNTQRDCWVIVPTWAHVEQSLRSCYSVNTSITVCSLTDLLDFGGQNIVLDYTLRKAQHRLFSQPTKEETPFCVLYQDHADARLISESEYNDFCHQIHDFGLFIDLQKPKYQGGHLVKIVRDGSIQEVRLSSSEVYTLAFLMRHRSPLSLRQIEPIKDLSSPIQFIERARRKVDWPTPTNPWQYFQTISACGRGSSRGYQFAPVPGAKWALIMPYQAVMDEIAPRTAQAMKQASF